ncbi:MAG: inosine/xanthosine triphosphatase [Acidobacteria bacterium]|nr:inosine/xanthosine triphosphatase [Acidobacteriota bacterium]MBI3421837.1 inosine/xanthosine triphosphatase [Acidobacteriota bacterium]
MPFVFAVGSTNPVKIQCVAAAIAQFWPDVVARGVATDSGVSQQPVADDEMCTGARNRARQALQQIAEADYGVGIEGGVCDTAEGMWAYAWVVIVARDGSMGTGQTGRFMLPAGVAQLVRAGLELGEADDRFFGRENSKQKEGAIGLLSSGKLDRLQLYQQGVTFALLRFVNPEFYERNVASDD